MGKDTTYLFDGEWDIEADLIEEFGLDHNWDTLTKAINYSNKFKIMSYYYLNLFITMKNV